MPCKPANPSQQDSHSCIPCQRYTLRLANDATTRHARCPCRRTQVEAQHVHYELSAAKFSWDHPRVYSSASRLTSVTVVKDPYEACKDAHAICVLTGGR